MNKKVKLFLERSYAQGSYYDVLQNFLQSKEDRGLSSYSIIHLYSTLYSLGEALGNPSLKTMTHHDLKAYENKLWLRYARGTMRPLVGDIKQFFRWCKEREYHSKDIGKPIKMPRLPRIKQNKAASEANIKSVIQMLV